MAWNYFYCWVLTHFWCFWGHSLWLGKSEIWKWILTKPWLTRAKKGSQLPGTSVGARNASFVLQDFYKDNKTSLINLKLQVEKNYPLADLIPQTKKGKCYWSGVCVRVHVCLKERERVCCFCLIYNVRKSQQQNRETSGWLIFWVGGKQSQIVPARIGTLVCFFFF